jgi:hypothetical protein
MTEFQQTIKESQRKEREAQLDDLDEIDRKMEQKNS